MTQYNLTGKSDEFEMTFRLGFIKEFYVSYYIPYLSKKQKGGLEANFNLIEFVIKNCISELGSEIK